MKVLIAYYSETGNTVQVAQAIGAGMASQGHEVCLMGIGAVAADTLSAYDLVILGSACHDADLATPVKQILDQTRPRQLSSWPALPPMPVIRPKAGRDSGRCTKGGLQAASGPSAKRARRRALPSWATLDVKVRLRLPLSSSSIA
jgi:multimeric flavodoxin WrbA